VTTQDAATQTALDAWADRVDRQLEQQARQQTTPQPTLYAGGGRVKPLGAAGPLPARGTTTTGGMAIGDPVATSQGLVGAMGSLDTVSRQIAADFRQVYGALGEVAIQRGIQVGAADPSDTAGDGSGTRQLGRYPYDLYWRPTQGALYYWNPSTSSTPGTWAAFAQQASGPGDPDTAAVVGVVAGATYTDTDTGQAYAWDGAAWVAQGGGAAIQVIAGDPNALDLSPAGGTLAASSTYNRLFWWDEDRAAWVPAGNRTFFVSGDPSTSVSYPYPGDIAQGFDGLIMIYDGVQWIAQWYCPTCDGGSPSDPTGSSGGGYVTTPGYRTDWPSLEPDGSYLTWVWY